MTGSVTRLLGIVALVLTAVVARATTTYAATDTVTVCDNSAVPGSLRAVLSSASSGDTINFSCSGTISISASSGGFAINNNLTIDGGNAITIDGGGTSVGIPIFTVTGATGGLNVALKNIVLQNGYSNAGAGGAVDVTNGSTLSVDHASFLNNHAAVNGGAISTSGTLTVTNSTFTGNSAGAHGGAIDANYGPTYPGNPPATALYADTFNGNSAVDGGAASFGTNNPASIINSTFNANTASGDGAALYTYAAITMSFSTVAFNDVSNPAGGSALSFDTSGNSGLTLIGTILANKTNCSATGTRTDNGSNLTYSGDHCGLTNSTDKFDTDPQLGSLANNGGPTQTMALPAGSPAVDGATTCTVGSTQVGTDQRGVTRPQGKYCDIGAYELSAAGTPTFSSGQDGSSTWGGTAANPLLLFGTAAANATVTLFGTATCTGSSIAFTTADTLGNWSIPVPAISSEGSYTYSATESTAIATASGCSSPIHVNVDRTAPTSAVTFPALGTNPVYLNSAGWNNAGSACGAPATICGTASDNPNGSGVAAVYVAIEGPNGTFWNGQSGTASAYNTAGTWVKATGTTNWSLAVPQPPDGTYTIASAAIDNAGNVQTIFQQSVAGMCTPASQGGGSLSLNGGSLSINGGLCTVNGTSGGAPVSGALSFSGGSLSLNGGSLSLNGGSLSLNGGSLSLNGGQCTVADNSGNTSTYSFSGGSLSLNGGSLSLNGGSLSLNGGSLSLNGGSLSLNGGSLSLNGGAGINVPDGGTVTLNGAQCTSVNATNGTSGSLSLNGGSLSLNGGSLSLNGGSAATNGGSLSINGGSLSLNGGSLSLNGGSLSINGGAGGNAGNVVIDNTPPVVSRFEVDGQEATNAQNIDPSATFHISFSKSMNPSTVTSNTVIVAPAPASPPACDAGDTTCQHASFSGFSPNTVYTVTVGGGATDLAGNGLVSSSTNPNTFTFTTAGASPFASNSTAGQDDDGDGIPNGWDGAATPLFIDPISGATTNTLAMGFSPEHKDLCLVENYMAGTAANGTAYDQHISQAANQAIVNSFANAPASNPDGKTGVHLVIFEGPNYSAGLPAGYSGPYFGGPIAMTDPIGTTTGGGFNWATKSNSGVGPSVSFDDIRKANFAKTGLAQFCHYAVIAHTLGGSGSSGSSRGIGSSDMVIALGGTVKGAGVGTQQEQEGTVMHELGHNLGLHHGGGPAINPTACAAHAVDPTQCDMDVNYKPDYLSVMNYFYQFEGVPGGFTTTGLDYSHGTITTPLDESGLSDAAGLGAGAAPSGASPFGTRYFCSGSATPNVIADATQPINWACSSSGPAPTGTTVAADIIASGAPTAEPYLTLHDFNDWANLNFHTGDIGQGSVPPPATNATVDISSDALGGGEDNAPAIESKAVASFAFTGFFAPISSDTTGTVINAGKAGKTYPVKFQLKDATGNYVNTLTAVRSITYSTSSACTGGATDTIDYATTSTSGLHYDTTANQYMYNWATPSAGCYMLHVNLSDGTTYLSLFSLS